MEEYSVDAALKVIRMHSFGGCVQKELSDKATGACATAAIACALPAAATGVFSIAVYFECLAISCSTAAGQAFAVAVACCGCDSAWYCSWAAGSCSQKGSTVYVPPRPVDLFWYRHTGYRNGANTWENGGQGSQIGASWAGFRKVFGGQDGVIYAIDTDGNLLWYKHTGYRNGANTWESANGRQVGTGWGDFTHVFGGRDGIIYAIDTNGNLLWYKHTGYQNGANSWQSDHGIQVGTSWRGFLQVLGGPSGIIYAVTTDGTLYWYKHTGYRNGANTWANAHGTLVGVGWNGVGFRFPSFLFDKVVAGDDGVIYRVESTGASRLFWYKHTGYQNGTNTWENDGQGKEVGTGWQGIRFIVSGISEREDGQRRGAFYVGK